MTVRLKGEAKRSRSGEARVALITIWYAWAVALAGMVPEKVVDTGAVPEMLIVTGVNCGEATVSPLVAVKLKSRVPVKPFEGVMVS